MYRELIYKLEKEPFPLDQAKRSITVYSTELSISQDNGFSIIFTKSANENVNKLQDYIAKLATASNEDTDFVVTRKIENIIHFLPKRPGDEERLWVLVHPSDIYPPYLALPEGVIAEMLPYPYRQMREMRLENCRIVITDRIIQFLKEKYNPPAIGIKISRDDRYRL